MTDTEWKFTGFEEPKQNWSKLPHQIIECLSEIKSVSELKVILYILRHTWGYGDNEKRITIEEFCTGRTRSDGTNIDSGCGIWANSVRAGLDAAVEHGYITVTVDDSDLGRVKKYYFLRMAGEEINETADTQTLHVGVQTLHPRTSKVAHRTKKETIERNLGKESTKKAQENQTNQPTPQSSAIPWQRQPSKKESVFLHLNARCPAAQRRPIVDALIAVHGLQAVIDSDSPDADRELNKMHELACVLHEMKMGVKDIERFSKLWQEKDFRGQKKQRPQNGQFLTFVSQQLADTSDFPAEDPGEHTTVTITDSWEA